MRCDKNSTWPKLMRQKNQIDCGDDLTFHKLCPLTCVPSRVIPSGVSQGFLIRTIPYKKDPFSCCKFTDAKGGGFLIGRRRFAAVCSGKISKKFSKVLLPIRKPLVENLALKGGFLIRGLL